MKFTEKYKNIMERMSDRDERADDEHTAQHVEKMQFQKEISRLEDKIRKGGTPEEIEKDKAKIKKLKAAVGIQDEQIEESEKE